MFEVKSILRSMTRKEIGLSILFGLFGIVLLLSAQYAVIIYPFLIALAGTVYILNKLEKEKNNDVRSYSQTEDIKKAYDKINDAVHEFRAPLAGLKMACEQLSLDPENKSLVLAVTKTFPKQVDKLFLLTTEISKLSKELEADHFSRRNISSN